MRQSGHRAAPNPAELVVFQHMLHLARSILYPSSFNSCKARMLLSFPGYEGSDPAPKGGQLSFHPTLTLELMRRYRCWEDVNHLPCFGLG